MLQLLAFVANVWALLFTPTPAPIPEPVPVVVPEDPFRLLAQCESGGDPTAVSPDGLYRGLFQFEILTWRAVVVRAGFPEWAGRLASDAPADVQLAAAKQLQSERGFQPWPLCRRKLGLA